MTLIPTRLRKKDTPSRAANFSPNEVTVKKPIAPAISFKGVGTRFPGAARKSLDNITLTVAEGEIFGVIGTSGAGKSTLVRTINGLHRPTEGTVTVLGKPVDELDTGGLRALRRSVAMVFQHHNLLESATIAHNVALPLILANAKSTGEKISGDEITQRVEKTLDLVGLGGRGNDYPSQLSGGQRQRVGIARALVTRPKILLCDEPTSALDPITTRQILDLIASLADKLGITVVVITHQMEVISRICDRVAVLDAGHLVEKGPVDKVFARPGAPLTKKFVGALLSRVIPQDQVARITAGTWDSVVAVTGTLTETSGLTTKLAEDFHVHADIVYATSLPLAHTTLSHIVLGLNGTQAGVEAALTELADNKRLDDKLIARGSVIVADALENTAGATSSEREKDR